MVAREYYPFLTSKERDVETGLDFFEARYYSATQGRFTSADPLHASATITDPQSFNRYSYVGNMPLTSIDPNGMDDCKIGETCSFTTMDWATSGIHPEEAQIQESVTLIIPPAAPINTTIDPVIFSTTITLASPLALSGLADGVTPSDDPPSSSGYFDINVSYGSAFFIGPTGGVMFDQNGWYPYIGGGFMNPGLSASVTGSNDSVSGGFNAELQGGYGPLYGSVGVDQEGNTFLTHGAGRGVSATAYYVFGAPHPPSGPHRPMNNDSRNSNSNRRGTERPGKSNCACNRN